MHAHCVRLPTRQSANRRYHALLAVVEPRLHVLSQRLPTILGAQSQQLPLTDARRSQRGEIVSPPLLGHPYAQHAHAHDIVDVAIVVLHLHRREDQRPFFVHVTRRRVIGRRYRVADVGLVGFRHHREPMHARFVDDRHQHRQIRRMRAAVVGRVVQERVPTLEVGMKLHHRKRHHVGAHHDMNRQTLTEREQFRFAGEDATGEIPPRVDHSRACGAQQRIVHLRCDAFQALGEHRHEYIVEEWRRIGAWLRYRHRYPSSAGVDIDPRRRFDDLPCYTHFERDVLGIRHALRHRYRRYLHRSDH